MFGLKEFLANHQTTQEGKGRVSMGKASFISLAEVTEVFKKLLSGTVPGVDEIM